MINSTLRVARTAQPGEVRFAFDFSECDALQQNGVVLIGGLARLLKRFGAEVRFRWETLKPDVLLGLGRNGFLSAFGGEAPVTRGNTIPFREHGAPRKHEILPYLEREWLERGWINLDEDVKSGILGDIWELYANADEHAHSPIGVLTCGQYYPNKGKVRLAIVDFGVGIPQNVRDYAENSRLAAAKALEWAFKPMTSTKVGGRGLGLATVKDLIRANRGQMQLFSNDGHCVVDENGDRYFNRTSHFEGTIVTIELRYDTNCVYSYSPGDRRRRRN
jgi:hypothetical protein